MIPDLLRMLYKLHLNGHGGMVRRSILDEARSMHG